MGRNRWRTAAFAFALLARSAEAQLVFTDLGSTAPTPGQHDISQLLTTGDTAGYNGSGINYYDNNSGSTSPGASGQTFTTGSDAGGYVLTNLAIKFGGLNAGGSDLNGSAQGWRIEIFRLSVAGNTTASLVFSNQTPGTTTTHALTDWFQFSGFAVPLSPNTTYAYTIVDINNRSTSYCDLGYATNKPYSGGAVCRIPTAGGTVTYYLSDNISAAFDIGLALSGPPFASTPSVSPSGSVSAGSPVTLTESAVGNAPLFYQWQADGGSGIFTNIPKATNASFNLTPMHGGSLQFDVIVSNSLGSVTSTVVLVSVVPPAGTADVTVNVLKPMAQMPLQGLGVCSATYDNVLIDSRVAQLLKVAGISAVRYPGGSYADIFNWQTTTANAGGYVNLSDSFSNFMNTVVNPAGAQAVITINYGSNPANNAGGDTNVAAAWVANARANNWAIKYWEIGNEIYGNGFYGTNSDWEYDLHYANTTASNRVRQAALSPSAYGSNAVAFIKAMKAKDATIKCGVFIQQPGTYPDTDTAAPWNLGVLTNCASNIDFVILHYYPGGNPATLLAQPATIPSIVQSTYAEMSNEIGGTIASQLQLAITETGAGTNTGAVVSLWTADNYLSWIENGVVNVDYQILHDDILQENQAVGHAYYGAQMAHLLANIGDTFVATTSDQSTLRVHAASRQDGQVGVMLLNTSPTLTNTVTVSIVGTNLAATGTQYQFGLTNFIGASDLPSYPVATNTVFGLGNQFAVSVPPYSMIDLLIPVASNTPPVLAAISNQTVNVGQTVSFTASVTDTNQPPPMLAFNLLGAPTNATINSATGFFTWRPLVTQADSTNQFTLTVSDNGSPSLSASQHFAITVNPLPLPTVSQPVFSNGQFTLELDGANGPDYAVQVSTNLTNWQTIFTTNSPTMPLTWTDTNMSTGPERFYRIDVGPPLPP